jgi:hypothetical protein
MLIGALLFIATDLVPLVIPDRGSDPRDLPAVANGNRSDHRAAQEERHACITTHPGVYYLQLGNFSF